MFKKTQNKKYEIINKKYKGSAVAYALSIIFAVSLIVLSMVQYVSSQAKGVYRDQERQQALQVAEAGLNFYRWYLAHQTDGKTAQQIDEFWQNNDPKPLGVDETYEKEYEDLQGGALGKYYIDVDKPENGSSIAEVVVVGTVYKNPSIKRTIHARFRRPSWSDFAVLTNQYSHFDANWNIKGKVMSNTGVHFDGVSQNIVYGGLGSYYDLEEAAEKPGVWTSWENEFNTTQSSEVFLAGKKYPAVQKDFSGVAVDLSMMKLKSQEPSGTTVNNCTSTGCYFESSDLGRHIILNSNGTFSIRSVTAISNHSNSIKTEGSSSNFNIPSGGLIFVSGSVWVEGIVNDKRVTIVAANVPSNGSDANIYVGMNNIAYTNFDGSDVVGLIAQGNIEFTTDGPSDLILDAAMLAKNGGVIKKDYNPNCCGGGCEEQKNTLGIFGSVASNTSLKFTQTKACNNEKAVGFQSKQINYDNNLLTFPPPFFPSETQYVFDRWDEQ